MLTDTIYRAFFFSPYSTEFSALVLWILNINPELRPSANEIQLRLDSLISVLDSS